MSKRKKNDDAIAVKQKYTVKKVSCSSKGTWIVTFEEDSTIQRKLDFVGYVSPEKLPQKGDIIEM